MTTKAERLARELLVLRLKYAESDFQGAMELLSSRDFIAPLLEAVRSTKGVRSTKALSTKASSKRQPSSGAQAATDRLMGALEQDSELRDFIGAFLSRDLLPSGSNIKAFANQIEIEFPQKLPSRIAIAEKLAAKLRVMPRDQRAPLMNRAARASRGESSLQLWSNLIVKGEK